MKTKDCQTDPIEITKIENEQTTDMESTQFGQTIQYQNPGK